VNGVAQSYDANGNMTVRVVDGVTYVQAWDAENRLASATNRATGETTTFAYDAEGTLVKRTTATETTYYVGGIYEAGEKLPVDVTPVNGGVLAQDAASGTGYLMYSAESVQTRFDPPPPGAAAEHFIAVIYDGAWKYDSNSAYYTFTPTNTDVLVADVDLSANTVSDLAWQRGMYYGVAYGYAGGDLAFEAEMFGGETSPGEFQVTGSYLIANAITRTRYYHFNGQRVAMRRAGPEAPNVLYFLQGDHGSLPLADSWAVWP
jgi:YD repeat-containing protein